jgi:hypothetical protein
VSWLAFCFKCLTFWPLIDAYYANDDGVDDDEDDV